MNLLENTLRLRMFAGPNGSGKSTIKSILKPNLLGFYINPDEIEAEITKYDFLDFGHYGIQTDRKKFWSSFKTQNCSKKLIYQMMLNF